MSDIQIGSPESLWLLWLVPLTLIFFIYSFRKKTKLLERFASPEMLARLTAGVSRQRQVLKAGLADNWSQVRMAASVLNRVFWAVWSCKDCRNWMKSPLYVTPQSIISSQELKILRNSSAGWLARPSRGYCGTTDYADKPGS